MEAKREFDHVSRLIKTEVSRFEKERIDDFKKALEDLLNGMIARQHQVSHRSAMITGNLNLVDRSFTLGNTIKACYYGGPLSIKLSRRKRLNTPQRKNRTIRLRLIRPSQMELKNRMSIRSRHDLQMNKCILQ